MTAPMKISIVKALRFAWEIFKTRTGLILFYGVFTLAVDLCFRESWNLYLCRVFDPESLTYLWVLDVWRSIGFLPVQYLGIHFTLRLHDQAPVRWATVRGDAVTFGRYSASQLILLVIALLPQYSWSWLFTRFYGSPAVFFKSTWVIMIAWSIFLSFFFWMTGLLIVDKKMRILASFMRSFDLVLTAIRISFLLFIINFVNYYFDRDYQRITPDLPTLGWTVILFVFIGPLLNLVFVRLYKQIVERDDAQREVG